VGVPPLLQLQLQLQLQPQPANLVNGKLHKLDKRITEDELRKRSAEQQWVEDEVSSFEEVKVHEGD